MSVAEYAKQHGCSESKARVDLERMVIEGAMRKRLSWVPRTNFVGDRRPGSRIKVATYTVQN